MDLPSREGQNMCPACAHGSRSWSSQGPHTRAWPGVRYLFSNESPLGSVLMVSLLLPKWQRWPQTSADP